MFGNLGIKMYVKVKSLMTSKKGQSSMEYGIIIAVVVLLVVGVLMAFGEGIVEKVKSAAAGMGIKMSK